MTMLHEFTRLHGPNRPGTHSQGDEERCILDYFGDRIECWLDVGACDGTSCSNSRALALKGWGGVAVEPDPVALEALRETYADRDDIAIVGAAIGPMDGQVKFYSSGGGGVSTTSDRHRQKWESQARFETIGVPAYTVKTLLAGHPGPFAFMSLDVEGQSAELLELFPLREMEVELLCIEHDCKRGRIRSYCEEMGLTKVLYDSAENLIVGK